MSVTAVSEMKYLGKILISRNAIPETVDHTRIAFGKVSDAMNNKNQEFYKNCGLQEKSMLVG